MPFRDPAMICPSQAAKMIARFIRPSIRVTSATFASHAAYSTYLSILVIAQEPYVAVCAHTTTL